ncbi:MAG: FAD-dependent monooxygenase [Pseudomonadota bacterium]
MNTNMDAEVIIVGAGPVGLGLAIELGMRSIRCIVIEQNDRVGYNPRAKLTNVRSMELLRRWGVASRLRAASPMPKGYPSNVVFATSLAGFPLAKFENAFFTYPDGSVLYSESAVWVPQYTLEQVLLERAQELPTVSIQFGRRLESLTNHADHVEVTDCSVSDSGQRRLAARYVVGADGARSTVRQLLDIRMTGPGAMSPNFNVLFRAPGLAAMHDKGLAVQYWNINTEVPSLMGPMDDRGLWYIIATRLGAETSSAAIDPKDLIRRATGLDFEMEIISTDPWTALRLIADTYRKGRVFLAGDACHLHPPFGGYGMNMGLGDAVDLGWKLVATLEGWAGGDLLDSYEAERKPVHNRVMDEAVINHSIVGNQLAREGLDEDTPAAASAREELGAFISDVKLREFKSLGLVLGYRYNASPIIVSDGTEPPQEEVINYKPSAFPGSLAPHFWLDDGSSLFDGFGEGFTLLAADDVMPVEFAALVKAAGEDSVPLSVMTLPRGSFKKHYGMRMAIIRPDQHVAWRGNELPPNVFALLDKVRGAANHEAASAAGELQHV